STPGAAPPRRGARPPRSRRHRMSTSLRARRRAGRGRGALPARLTFGSRAIQWSVRRGSRRGSALTADQSFRAGGLDEPLLDALEALPQAGRLALDALGRQRARLAVEEDPDELGPAELPIEPQRQELTVGLGQARAELGDAALNVGDP